MKHNNKRHRTKTLFTTLDFASGEAINQCQPCHQHQEFLRVMHTVEKKTEPGFDLHVILDNNATHKHLKVKVWRAKHPQVHLHFVPTSAS